jgi:hypothetical protein
MVALPNGGRQGAYPHDVVPLPMARRHMLWFSASADRRLDKGGRQTKVLPRVSSLLVASRLPEHGYDCVFQRCRRDDMTLDVGRLTRLKSAIDATLSMQAEATAAVALRRAARDYRDQVSTALPDELKQEFDTLFPPEARSIPERGYGMGRDILRAAQDADEARARLLGISGWLNGLVSTDGR